MLEARDRVGGRVHTVRAPFTDGLHAEAGGESIDDNHDAIQALVARFGLHTDARLADRETHGHHLRPRAGADRPPTYVAGRGGRVLADYDRYYAAVDRLGVGIDPEHPDAAPHAERLDRRSLADFIDDLHLVPEARFLVDIAETSEYATEPRNLSLLFVAQQSAVVAGRARTPRSRRCASAAATTRCRAAMAAALGDGGPARRRGPRGSRRDRDHVTVHEHGRPRSTPRTWCSRSRRGRSARSGSRRRSRASVRRVVDRLELGPGGRRS